MNTYVEEIRQIAPIPDSDCSIDYMQLSQVARKFAKREYKVASWGGPFFPHFPTDHKTFVEFIGVGNAINFCFSNPETGEKFAIDNPAGHPDNPIISGSAAMWACLKRALDNDVHILDPNFLADLTIADVRGIFRTSRGYPSLPMIHERVSQLRDVGKTLLSEDTPFSSFNELVHQSGTKTPCVFTDNGSGIVEQLLTHFKSYQDVRKIRKRHATPAMIATFAKRAQLFALMYQGRSLSSKGKLVPLADPGTIGPIADYQVPKTLRSLGILVYGDTIGTLIDKEKSLREGESFEIGIRVNTVQVIARLLEEINEYRLNWNKKIITIVELDFVLWKTGSEDTKAKHHLTRTTAY